MVGFLLVPALNTPRARAGPPGHAHVHAHFALTLHVWTHPKDANDSAHLYLDHQASAILGVLRCPVAMRKKYNGIFVFGWLTFKESEPFPPTKKVEKRKQPTEQLGACPIKHGCPFRDIDGFPCYLMKPPPPQTPPTPPKQKESPGPKPPASGFGSRSSSTGRQGWMESRCPSGSNEPQHPSWVAPWRAWDLGVGATGHFPRKLTWRWIQIGQTRNGLPLDSKSICGPIPGGVISSHTHMASLLGFGTGKIRCWSWVKHRRAVKIGRVLMVRIPGFVALQYQPRGGPEF